MAASFTGPLGRRNFSAGPTVLAPDYAAPRRTVTAHPNRSRTKITAVML